MSGVTWNGIFSRTDRSVTCADAMSSTCAVHGSTLTRPPSGSAEVCWSEAKSSAGAAWTIGAIL